MANFYNPCFYLFQSPKFQSFLTKITILIFMLLVNYVNSISFNFTTFQPNMVDINFQGDAFPSNGVIQLTNNRADGPLTRSAGRASYAKPVQLWDARTGRLTDFTTHFSFIMNSLNSSWNGDGISFFLAPFESDIPTNSTGGYLALFSDQSAFSPSENQIVAVEFDSFKNVWDPSPDHIGININSIVSVANETWEDSINDGTIANAWVNYNSTTQNLRVFLTYAENPIFSGNYSLSHVVDLRNVLPESVRIGFSAATGAWIEIHNILSWSFNSTLGIPNQKRKTKVGLGIGLGFGFLGTGLGLVLFFFLRKQDGGKRKEEIFDASMDNEFEKGTGPKRFAYSELSQATNNFAEEGKLGEGGFGGVYKGLLNESNTQVAVKRVSRGSKQGKKEYISEVRIISRLRHRNLVQLIGWCHEQGEFLLVYEFMPNGSLDFYLFGGKLMLSWTVRYKIVLGLTSALLYLHEEWEQCVLHRDIKSSNIMLDSNFNAKLGDFGLARLVDHELGLQTTVLAGTMGYLAPECVIVGKASKESDVYSFGAVALEISCGRRPIEPKEEAEKVRLVEWVWDLYGKGKILEAVDKRLSTEFDEKQIECLMIVGLWCCHPDSTMRPSIRQVINVLKFEAPLPNLASKLPVAMYFAPPLVMCKFSYTSFGTSRLVKDTSQCSCSSCSTYSSRTSGSSSRALLNSI